MEQQQQEQTKRKLLPRSLMGLGLPRNKDDYTRGLVLSGRQKRNRHPVLLSKAVAEMSREDFFMHKYGVTLEQMGAAKQGKAKPYWSYAKSEDAEVNQQREKEEKEETEEECEASDGSSRRKCSSPASRGRVPYRESNPEEKQKLRQLLALVIRLLPRGGLYCLLDDENWQATRYLISVCGIDPKRIFVPQNDEPSYLLMKANMPEDMPPENLLHCSMSEFLDATEQHRCFFRFFWCDFCQTFSGQQKYRDLSPRADMERIFSKRHMLDYSALAITINTRNALERLKGLPREVQCAIMAEQYEADIKETAARHGYRLEGCSVPISPDIKKLALEHDYHLEDSSSLVSHYANSNSTEMLTLLFFVYQQT